MPRDNDTATPKERAKPQVARAPLPPVVVGGPTVGYIRPTPPAVRRVDAPPINTATPSSGPPSLGLMYTSITASSTSSEQPPVTSPETTLSAKGASMQDKAPPTLKGPTTTNDGKSFLYSKPHSSSSIRAESEGSRSVSSSSSAARATRVESPIPVASPRQQVNIKGQHHRPPGGGAAPGGGPASSVPSLPQASATTASPPPPPQFLTDEQQTLSRAHAPDYLTTCTLQQLPAGPSLSLHKPYDVLEAIVDRLPFEYLSRPSLSTNLALRAAAAAQEQGGGGRLPSQGYQSLSSLKYNLLPPELVKNIVLAARDLLMSESLILQIEAPVVIAGDLHGQFQDLINVFAAEPPCGGKYLSRLQNLNSEYADFKAAGSKGGGAPGDRKPDGSPSTAGAKRDRDGAAVTQPTTPRKYLFLGDYVDRGDYSVETMILLLCLKILQPTQMFLLRGNHESATISRTYGFMRECTNKYGHGPGGLGGESIWKSFVDMFMCLPVIALVNNSIFCVHGGIPRDLDSMQRIFAMQDVRPYDTPNNGFLCDLVWCDPEDHDAEYLPNSRRVSYTFNEGALDMFLKRNQLQLVCRAHQVMEHGYGFFPPPRGGTPSTRKLVTIFTASNYVNSFANAGAIMLVDEDMTLHFKVFHPVGLRELAVLERGVAPEDALAARLSRHRALEVAEGSTMMAVAGRK